jgi:hypothetical protein
MYTVFTYRVCKRRRGYGVLGLRKINTCRKVIGQFLWMTTFCNAFCESYLSTIGVVKCRRDIVKETPRRKTVTSSLNDISTDQLRPPPPLSTADFWTDI